MAASAGSARLLMTGAWCVCVCVFPDLGWMVGWLVGLYKG